MREQEINKGPENVVLVCSYPRRRKRSYAVQGDRELKVTANFN